MRQSLSSVNHCYVRFLRHWDCDTRNAISNWFSMKTKARPTFTKLLVTRFATTIAALLAVVLAAGSQQVFGDEIKDFDKATKELKDATNDEGASKVAKDATDTIDKANKEAKDNKPEDADAKKAADDWDKKGRDADDATKANEKAAKEAEQTAKAAADKAAEDDQKAKGYIKALEKRRKARKILKAAIAKLEEFKRAAGGGAYTQGLVEPLKKKIGELQKKLKDAEITIAMGATGPHDGEFAALVSTGKIKVETSGTGETIGHVANLQIQNTTGERISFIVPPTVLESGSGRHQHYACPHPQTVVLDPHATKTVPIDGVCLVRTKPPAGKDDTGDLVVTDGNPKTPRDPGSHLGTRDCGKLLSYTKAKYDAAEKLEKQGLLKDLPYSDPQKRKDIVVQWSTWTDPRIGKITGVPPATKEDLKKVVYKQTEERGPVTPEVKKKLDTGIDTIFEKIELTTAKAKTLEQPDPFKDVELTGDEGKGAAVNGTINISDDPPKPATQEKAPGEKPQKDEKTKDKSDKPETKDSGKTPPSATQEKKPKAKKRPPIEEAREHLEEANDKYNQAWKKYRAKHPDEPRRKELVEAAARLRGDIGGQREAGDVQKEADDLWDKIHRDFDHSFEGEKLKGKIDEATQELKPLEDREKAMEKEMEKYGVKKVDPSPSGNKTPDEKPKPGDGKDTKGKEPSERQEIK